jgi:hypothetical protein
LPIHLAFKDGWLYLAIGGFTNAGLPSEQLFYGEEQPFSSAILQINPNTLNQYTRFATGFRNPYDLVWHSTNGQLYATDNGANANFGNAGCTAPGFNPPTTNDELNRIVQGGYYGHPNFTRPSECVFGGGILPLHSFPRLTQFSSVTGIAEYTSANDPALIGNLFTTNYGSGEITRIQLAPGGTGLLTTPTAFATGLTNPLDLTVSSDGKIYIVEHGGRIKALVPRNLIFSTGPDYNGDRYSDIADYYAATNHYWIRLNNGNTTFMAPGTQWFDGSTIPNGAGWQILIGDFSGDGLVDYADLHLASGSVFTHNNLGNGAFSGPGADWNHGVVTACGTCDTLVGDLNSDRRADIIVHNRSTGELHLWNNNGPGVNMYSFAGTTAFHMQIGGDWQGLVGDFNGDGKADIADYHVPSAQIWIHENVGGTQFNGTSWAPVQGIVGNDYRLIVGDFTGDGYADFTSVNRYSGAFVVRENLRDTRFAPSSGGWTTPWSGQYTQWLGFSILGMPVTFLAQ